MSEYVIYRGGYQADYQLARIEVKTPKLYKLSKSTSYQRQIDHDEAALILDDADAAAALYQRILELREERDRLISEARADYKESVAQAIEAQRAETENTGSVADESAVAESDAPKGESR